MRAVLEFAKAQGANVELATQRFEVRRGLIEDLAVTATLGIDCQGVPIVHAACVVGQETFRPEMHTMSEY